MFSFVLATHSGRISVASTEPHPPAPRAAAAMVSEPLHGSSSASSPGAASAGRRDSTSVIVRVNGEPVLVEGGTRWRTKLPVARLRRMSPRFARTASVTLSNPFSSTETTYEIDLPIGLLGGTTPLAALEVTAW